MTLEIFCTHIAFNSWENWLAQDTSDFGGRKPNKVYAEGNTVSSLGSVPTIILGETSCWNREDWTLGFLRNKYGDVPFAFGTIEDHDENTDDDEILMAMDDFCDYCDTQEDRNPLFVAWDADALLEQN